MKTTPNRFHTTIITMEDSVGGSKFAQNKSKNSCNLKMIGRYWFLEVGGKLKRLKFLNDIYNVHIDDNVIFADESVYQVEMDANDVVKIIKIEDLYQSRDQLKPADHDAGHDLKEEASAVIVSAANTDKKLDIGNKDIRSTNDSRNIRDSVIDESLYPDCTDEIHEMGYEEYVSEDDEYDKNEELELGSDEYMHLPNKTVKPVTVKALGEYKARSDNEITFTKGDRLTVDDDIFSQGHTLVPATHQDSGQTGFIPSRFVVKDDNSLRSQEWWFDLNKEETEARLMSPCYKPRTFLIRDSSDKVSLVLSVKTFIPETLTACVYHYKIKRSDNGQFFINPTNTFANIPDLISFYRTKHCKLEEQCKKDAPTLQLRDLETPRQSVTIVKELYTIPGFGKVYIGKWRDKEVAVKSQNSGQRMTTEVVTDVNILHQLHHDKVVKLIAVYTKMMPFLTITELLINGPLLNYLRADRGNTLQLEHLTNIASQIADGGHYLKEQHIVHRNLQAFNILVGRKNEVKIVEFGLARRIPNESSIYKATNGEKCPVKWTSPEAIFELKFSTKSDVWSFGILLYEIITFGGMPYQGMTGNEVAERIRYGFRMPKPVTGPLTCPESYYEVMLQCWESDAYSRPTFAYLRDYFGDYHSS